MTVGSQMPFDRLSAAMALWARQQDTHEVLAQVGRTALSADALHGLQWKELMVPDDYLRACAEADLIVAHAGMGSVLTALELRRPLLVMPRRGALRETRNDHQLATARHLQGRPGVVVAMEPAELAPLLDRWLRSGGPAIEPVDREPAADRSALIAHLRGVITACRR